MTTYNPLKRLKDLAIFYIPHTHKYYIPKYMTYHCIKYIHVSTCFQSGFILIINFLFNGS